MTVRDVTALRMLCVAAWGLSVSATASPVPRPKSLDSRIPWLADLGLPQSGGPEPLVPVQSYALPRGSDLESLCSLGSGVVVTLQAANGPWTLLMLDADGKVRWSRTLPGTIRWVVLGEDSYCVAFPRNLLVNGKAQALLFDPDGRPLGDVDWSGDTSATAGMVQSARIRHYRLQDGVLYGSADDGSRGTLVVRAQVKQPAMLAMAPDLQPGGAGVPEAEHARSYQDGWIILGARQEPAPPEYLRKQYPDRERERQARNAERLKRAKPWIGKRLRIKDLPLFDPTVRGKKNWQLGARTYQAMGNVIAVEADGSVWLDGGIVNPYRLAPVEFERAGRVPYRAWAPMTALFGREGTLRSYLIQQPPMSGPIYPCGDGLIVREGDALRFWVAVRK